MKRNKSPIKVNGFVMLNKKQYRKVRKILNIGFFHTAEMQTGFKIRIIDNEIRQAILKVI